MGRKAPVYNLWFAGKHYSRCLKVFKDDFLMVEAILPSQAFAEKCGTSIILFASRDLGVTVTFTWTIASGSCYGMTSIASDQGMLQQATWGNSWDVFTAGLNGRDTFT